MDSVLNSFLNLKGNILFALSQVLENLYVLCGSRKYPYPNPHPPPPMEGIRFSRGGGGQFA